MIATRRWEGSLPLLWLAGTLLAVVALVALRFSALPGTICMFRGVTGIPCPTCGLTRAFSEITHAHLAEATRLHPLSIPLALEMAIAWALFGGATLAGSRLHLSRRALLGAAALHVAMFLSVWIYRLATGALPP